MICQFQIHPKVKQFLPFCKCCSFFFSSFFRLMSENEMQSGFVLALCVNEKKKFSNFFFYVVVEMVEIM